MLTSVYFGVPKVEAGENLRPTPESNRTIDVLQAPALTARPVGRNIIIATNIYATQPPKVLEISVVESEKMKADREAQEKRKASLRANYYLNSGSEYGDYIIIGEDTQYFNCVAYAKAMTGIARPLGAGGRSAIQGQEPRVGAIGSTKGNPHAVWIKSINGNQITFWEANYVRGKITQRTLPLSHFLGFVYL